MTQFASWLLKHREMGPLIGLITLSIVFHVVSGGRFFTLPQISAVAALSASLGMVALGVTMLMISGEFDLSVSQTFVLAPIVMATLINHFTWAPAAALLVATAAVSTIGLVNGLLTIFTGILSFIATLGMLFIVKSVNRTLASGSPVELIGEESWGVALMGGQLPNTPFSAPLIWMLAVGCLLWFVLQCTRHGNATRAVGEQSGNIARAMGVPVIKTKLLNFIMCAGLAGVAGCLQLASFGSASVNSGRDYNLMAIVAVVIGGTSLFGVQGTVVGSVLGAVLLGSLKSGLVLVGTSGEYYAGLIGVLLLGAAIVNAWIDSMRDRGRR